MAQILIVEDEESLLQTLRYNLSRAGHEVRLSTNGLQALDMIRGNPPELVVLDLMLPGTKKSTKSSGSRSAPTII